MKKKATKKAVKTKARINIDIRLLPANHFKILTALAKKKGSGHKGTLKRYIETILEGIANREEQKQIELFNSKKK